MGKKVTVVLGDALYQGLLQYCEAYKVRTGEAIRRAIRDLLQRTVWNPNLKEEEGS